MDVVRFVLLILLRSAPPYFYYYYLFIISLFSLRTPSTVSFCWTVYNIAYACVLGWNVGTNHSKIIGHPRQEKLRPLLFSLKYSTPHPLSAHRRRERENGPTRENGEFEWLDRVDSIDPYIPFLHLLLGSSHSRHPPRRISTPSYSVQFATPLTYHLSSSLSSNNSSRSILTHCSETRLLLPVAHLRCRSR